MQATHELTRSQAPARRLTPRRGLRVIRPAHEVDPGAAPALQTVSGAPAGLGERKHEPLRFGRFAVIGRLGAGAMSTVFAAHDPALGRKVAVKLVHDGGDVESRARARVEAHALARISHPNVVQIYEVGSHGQQMFVAMEFIAGVTLTAWQAERRSQAEVLRVYVQAGRGLVAAHAAGIVHRDFKSDNVLVGSDGRARVVDFGLALMLDGPNLVGGGTDHRSSPRLTSSGTVMGTPAYMSPEQHRGAALDERSDQFNFCAALYEALYRVRPFAGDTLREVARQVRAGTLQRPARGLPVSRRLHRALLRGLSSRPAQRWDSLAELLDHLEEIQRPTAAPRGSAALVGGVAVAGLWALLLGWALGLSSANTALMAGLNAALVLAAAAWLTGARVMAGRRLSGTR